MAHTVTLNKFFPPLSLLIAFLLSSSCPAAPPPPQPPRPVIQSGHNARVFAMAFSRDATTLATVSDDQTIKFWSLPDGMLTRTARCYCDTAAVSPDGAYIAAVNDNTDLNIWSISSGEIARTIKQGAGEDYFLIFSPDGKRIASAGQFTVNIYSIKDGSRIRSIDSESRIFGIAFSPDGKLFLYTTGASVTVVSSDTGDIIRVVETGASGEFYTYALSPRWKFLALIADGKLRTASPDGSTLHEFAIAPGQVARTTFSPDDNKILLEYQGGNIGLFSFAASATVLMLRPDMPGEGFETAFSPDGKLLATMAGGTPKVEVWNADTGALLREYPALYPGGGALRFSPDGALLALGAATGPVEIINLRTGAPAFIFAPRTLPVSALAWSPSGDFIASASAATGAIKIWSAATATLTSTIPAQPGITHLQISPDSARIAAVSRPNEHGESETPAASILEIATAQTISRRQTPGYAITPDWALTAEADEDGNVQIFSSASGNAIKKIALPSDIQCHPPAALEISPGGETLAVACIAGGAGKILLYPIQKEDPPIEIPVLDGASSIKALAFSPDGKQLAVSGEIAGGSSGWLSGAIQFVPLETGNNAGSAGVPPATLTEKPLVRASDNIILALAFSPDGKTLATGGNRGTIELWTTETGASRQKIIAHSSQVNSLAFSPDGRMLASAGQDGAIRFMDPATGENIAVLLPFDDNGWFALTPDGAIDCAPTSCPAVRWRAGNTMRPANEFLPKFFKPGLFANALGKKD